MLMLCLSKRAQITESVERLPKHTCVQTVRRSRFVPFSGARPGRCEEVNQEGLLASTERFKLDVTVLNGTEIFSWVGAKAFQSSDAQEIVGGLTASGDFSQFLKSIFAARIAEHLFLGLKRNGDRAWAIFSYHVPVETSHYQIELGSGDAATLGYEGKFWIDPQNAQLRRLTIVVPDPPFRSETCRVETEIDYQSVQIGSSRLLLPELTLLKLWDTDGSRYESRTTYGACRTFESSRSFALMCNNLQAILRLRAPRRTQLQWWNRLRFYRPVSCCALPCTRGLMRQRHSLGTSSKENCSRQSGLAAEESWLRKAPLGAGESSASSANSCRPTTWCWG
jgi:hypothetical protein